VVRKMNNSLTVQDKINLGKLARKVLATMDEMAIKYSLDNVADLDETRWTLAKELKSYLNN